MHAGRAIAGAATALALLAGPAPAQDEDFSENVVGSESDWTVFVEPEDSPERCWGASIPKESVNTDLDGNPKEVQRGDIVLFITHRADGDAAVVSFTGGYPFKEESFVTVEIADQSFKMFTEDDWAWAEPDSEDQLIEAMKGGADATLTARSRRGTITKDRFSLFGFTAAFDLAAEYCGT